jgi:coproporphyrinogen III oxidase
LMSLPPMARWQYGYRAPEGSREELLTDLFTRPQDWFGDPTLEDRCRPHQAID